MKKESLIQSEIVKFIKANDGWVIKVMRANENGCPDLLACMRGVFVGIEVKAEQHEANPNNQMSLWQVRQIKGITEAGGVAMCVATLNQCKEVLELELLI